MIVWRLARDKEEEEGRASKALEGTFFRVMESS